MPTEWERSPSLWQRAPERAWSWGVTCPFPWKASSLPMWWNGSSLECLFPSSSTTTSTLLMWIQSTLVTCLQIWLKRKEMLLLGTVNLLDLDCFDVAAEIQNTKIHSQIKCPALIHHNEYNVTSGWRQKLNGMVWHFVYYTTVVSIHPLWSNSQQ